MRKKAISFLLMAAFILPMAGCASVQKKFTRKKKEPKHIAATLYFEEGPYQKKYSNVYYYKTHYTMWKTWHEDLIKGIGGNRKKTERNAEEALSHLTQMKNSLVLEKQKELDPWVKEMSRYAAKFAVGAYSRSEEPGIRTELQKIKRMVDSDFYYDKVANQILPDTVNLGPAAVPQPASSSTPGAATPSPVPSPVLSSAKAQ